MNRPDDALGAKIVQHLDSGLDRLDPATRERLASARKVALAHYRGQPEPVFGLAWATNAISQKGGQRSHLGA